MRFGTAGAVFSSMRAPFIGELGLVDLEFGYALSWSKSKASSGFRFALTKRIAEFLLCHNHGVTVRKQKITSNLF